MIHLRLQYQNKVAQNKKEYTWFLLQKGFIALLENNSQIMLYLRIAIEIYPQGQLTKYTGPR